MKKILICLFVMIMSLNIFGIDSSSSSEGGVSGNATGDGTTEIPMIPIVPADKIPDGWLPEVSTGQDIDDITGYIRDLKKTYTVRMSAKVDIRIPLEIVTDVNLNIDIVGYERKNGKFNIELTKKPKEGSTYHIVYTNPDNPEFGGEDDVFIDVDGDGTIDTYIASKPITSSSGTSQGNKVIISDNEYVVIGDNIQFKVNGNTKSTYEKTIYMTVEMGAGL